MTTDKYTYLNNIMDMYWCGFNGFNQLNFEHNTDLNFHLYEDKASSSGIQQVTFSWSSASVLTGICNRFIYNVY